jgi:CheY-like chemotaxis protein/nitrogen-specific signal transduction histidine kinase
VDVALYVVSVLLLTFIYERLQNRAAERLEAAYEARRVFLAQMSHELRTPMNGVLGMLQLLDLETPLREQQEALGVLRRSGEAMVSMIDELLDHARLEAGQLRLRKAPFQPRSTLDDVVKLFQHQVRTSGVVLSLRVDDSVPSWLDSDGLRLRQVVQNLVANAVKFTPGGTVEVQIRWSDGLLQGAVIDSGIGMSEEFLSRIFQPFQQASAMQGGSGLGLMISRALCRLMGGDLTVRSWPGQGSVFTFTCRAPACEAPAEQTPQPVIHPGLRGRVLLVEDDSTNQLVVRRLCEKMGLQVELASDGAAALTLLEQQSFDLVLMDCQMPVLDGYEATRRLRAGGGASSRLPVLALTASTLPEEQERCIEVGMNEVLTKPIERARFEETLRRWLRARHP